MSKYPRLTRLVESREFSYFIITIILINAVFVGIELSNPSLVVIFIQKSCLAIFVIEIFLRWFGRRSVETYVRDWWNWFDIIIVLISFLPQGHPDNVEVYTAFRVIPIWGGWHWCWQDHLQHSHRRSFCS